MSNLNSLNRFKYASTSLDIRRSRFNMPHTHKTTFNAGDLVPIGLFEVLPSDTFEVSIANVIRMLTPVAPVMDNAYVDFYAFFVPNRIATQHAKDWEQICGENVNGYWAPQMEHSLSSTGNMVDLITCGAGSIGNYYGLPIINGDLQNPISISSLPFAGYIKIWNEWFRDQNTQPPQPLTAAVDPEFFDSEPLKVNKFHDYFTSCLPSPQKGESVLLPLAGLAPVVGDDISHALGNDLRFGNSNTTGNAQALFMNPSGSYYNNSVFGLVQGQAPSDSGKITSTNLVADLSSSTSATINQLRQAFAIQRMLEKDARGGSRYREILKVHFGANIPDSTIQIPQYLGGKRMLINLTQVLQTSSSDSVSPLGATGAFSNTSGSNFLFKKSFTEHGYIHILACVRNNQTYSQGVSKLWTRSRRYDWYYPAFANLGEQPVYKRELKYNDVNDSPDEIFGYQEAWADYRFIPNRVSGNFAPDSGDEILTAWTYTNNFSSQPTLNSSFMVQNKEQIGDTLVQTDTATQFLADFYFDIKATRPMPVYSIPGLIDHH